MLPGSVDRDALSGSYLDHSSQSNPLSNEHWIPSSEEQSWQFEDDYWDTDDEADESNAIDDAYKILEGDW
ncbi:hypothetical protein N7452_004192 [Penicillium brevicompactum]|uniref:Uncharacterized protein n=1 Tax=Penicillium brevicompactum TaxID=5074 RepID=A0A9W9QY10_PENBR|nr:hypothetical protein N7452_004192 [Penicillium brevicompactum]